MILGFGGIGAALRRRRQGERLRLIAETLRVQYRPGGRRLFVWPGGTARWWPAAPAGRPGPRPRSRARRRCRSRRHCRRRTPRTRCASRGHSALDEARRQHREFLAPDRDRAFVVPSACTVDARHRPGRREGEARPLIGIDRQPGRRRAERNVRLGLRGDGVEAGRPRGCERRHIHLVALHAGLGDRRAADRKRRQRRKSMAVRRRGASRSATTCSAVTAPFASVKAAGTHTAASVVVGGNPPSG